MASRRGRRLTITLATLVGAAVLWVGLLHQRAWLSADTDFDGVTWELANFPGKWLFIAGRPLRRDPPAEDALRGYFAMTNRNNEAARRLEPVVEAALNGRLDAALQDLGLPSLLGATAWPPVSVDLTEPPAILAMSPRNRIRLESARPISASADSGGALDLEKSAEERSPDRVALVVPLGGISTYPAIVTDDASYAGTLQVAAHEWVHHYFAFASLGWRTLVSREALTINETAADIAGAEIAARALVLSGDPAPAPEGSRIGGPEASRAREERDATLRALRTEVDALLLDGRTADAERRMEEVRLELEARGVRIRRLNQAYFAWYGTYAARGDSVDPLGRQLRELRRATGSLPEFLTTVGRTASRADVARVLEELAAAPTSATPP